MKVAVITGDVKGSSLKLSSEWIDGLKQLLSMYGKESEDWSIHRGDEFQLQIKEYKRSLIIAFHIKAYFKSKKHDVRMCIGIGEINYDTIKIAERNGSAFVFSGKGLDQLKKDKVNLLIISEDKHLDALINLLMKLLSSILDNWLPESAKYVMAAIEEPKLSQSEIGMKLGINQAAISRRKSRSNFDLLMEVNSFYQDKI